MRRQIKNKAMKNLRKDFDENLNHGSILKKSRRKKDSEQIHNLGVAIRIGKNGLTLNVLEAITRYLRKHEYMKIKFLRSFIKTYSKEDAIKFICEKLQARLVDTRGHVIVIHKNKQQKNSSKNHKNRA